MRRAILATLILLAALAPARADDATEQRLRDALRAATAQLGGVQDQLAAVQSKEAADQQEIARLKAQPSAPAPKVASPREAAALRAAVAEFNEKLAAQNEAIAKWKSAYDDLVAKQPDQKAIQQQIDDLTKRNAALQAKNEALFKVANDILERYAHVTMSDVIAHGEPFIGTAHVELENEIQDEQDKLLDQRGTP